MNTTQRLLLLLLFAQACAAPKVVHFTNEGLDYASYKTYRLINYKSDDKSYDEEGLEIYSHIEETINRQMTDKQYVAARKPDLIARYEIVSTTTVENNARNYDPYGYRRPYYAPGSWSLQKHVEGVILIELKDRKKKKLVWQGSLDLKYSKRKTPEEILTECINNIFSTYPYQAGSNDKIIVE